jgi:hypothetical protein
LELASVLFNEQAACSIWRLQLKGQGRSLALTLAQLQRADKDQTIPDMDEGSIVIKTIWESVRRTPNHTETVGVPVFYKGILDDRGNVAKRNNNLGNPIQWDHKITIDTGSQDEACTGPSSDVSFPQSCFFLIPLTQSDSPEFQRQIANRIFVNGSDNSPAYAILVGLNMMELEKEFPNWLWSSFWWAKEPDDDFQDLPRWKHFSYCAVSAPRSARPIANFPVEFKESVCFNPYLEGASDPNGIISNCLSCHQFAAYRPRTPDKEPTTQTEDDPCSKEKPTTQRNDGSCLGLPNDQNIVGTPTKCAQTPVCYWKKSLATRFLWSVADIQ